MSKLLVNPWIYDFAAHDFGIKPVGLLKIASILRERNEVFFIDCLSGPRLSKKESGFSKFKKEEIDKPSILKEIKRPYFRYGVSILDFENKRKVRYQSCINHIRELPRSF